jgi:hypothetical protein
MAATMTSNDLMMNAHIPVGVGVPSNPIRMGEGNNALSVQGLVIAGTLATASAPALGVEQSNDGVNWTAVSGGVIAAFGGATALDLRSGEVVNVTQRFARVVVMGAAGSAAIVNISASPYRA